MRKFQADAGGGVCRSCRMRLPEWDTREHCDACLSECREYDHRRHVLADEEDYGNDDDDE